MGDPTRTEFTPRKVYDRRSKHSLERGDTYYGTTGVYNVEYDPDFDIFAARAAYGLRLLVVYRTDGGKFARGLVRVSGYLQDIHDDLKKKQTPKGFQIRLVARLYRRKDPIPQNRWEMSVQFARAAEDMIKVGADPVTASQSVTDFSQEKAINQVIYNTNVLFARYPEILRRSGATHFKNAEHRRPPGVSA